jgi:hypothetical protein
MCVMCDLLFVIVAKTKKRSIPSTHTNTLTGDFFHTSASVLMAIVNKVLSFHPSGPFTFVLGSHLDRVNSSASAANPLQVRARGVRLRGLRRGCSIYANLFPLYVSRQRNERQGSSLVSPSATFLHYTTKSL